MKGSCLCKAIKYEMVKFEPKIANCFCSMCRKISGTSHATYGSVRIENLVFLSGEEFIRIYQSSDKAERGFCSICGSNLFYRLLNQNSCIEIALGSLDDEPNIFPDANIYIGSRTKWSLGLENLVNYHEGRLCS